MLALVSRFFVVREGEPDTAPLEAGRRLQPCRERFSRLLENSLEVAQLEDHQ